MTESLRFESFQAGNVHVHVCSTEKFKTNLLMAMVQQELSSQHVTQHALLPSVLQRGTRSYPTTLGLKRKLDELYGAGLFGDVGKRGENHVLQLGLEVANERFLSGTSSLLEEGAAFLGEVLLHPATDGDRFADGFVQAEKKNLRQKIESLMDDKIRYAAHRCVSEMCAGEPYALFNHGRVEDFDHIDADTLYTYYRQLLQSRPLDLYFVGHLSRAEVESLVKRHFQVEGGKRSTPQRTQVRTEVNEVKHVVDRLNIKQGKLNMGFRTPVTLVDDAYPALLMYNGILGGFPHSKLFINVREKASLAYYAASRIESHKGILTVQSGIEIENYQRAVDIIQEQIEMMAQGKINDTEWSQTRTMLIHQLRERQDRAYDLIDAHYHGVLSGRERPLEEMIQELEAVTQEDVIAIARQVKLDTIYFLRDQKGGADDGTD
ncbi:EF-P 5-aminopentanol modification-associated protein YfmF [Desmospora activa]|uniref:Putative Zn-dependent peptidase n=1 Tax=Desmospora activa DSM 45169 TaxID=1121389 RepID=A0A2T4ZAL5_9BACL|nr:pitrilysin family protein [Desmospora activa]PTM58929.1 putative Zn-dependent peptidase [Desmospora activa DSM 45169]